MNSNSPSSPRTCLAVILAAGEGTRMMSSRPKVLHTIAHRSLLAHVLTAVAAAGASDIAIVVGPGREDVADEARRVQADVQVFTQAERLGTAHAVLAARTAFAGHPDDVIIAYADTPLVQPETFSRLREALANGAAVAVLGFEPDDPTGYGRLIMDGGQVVDIREQKDAVGDELTIRTANAGLMALSGEQALTFLEAIDRNNAQNEYYLTDAVKIARSKGLATAVVMAPVEEVMGVNDRIQLAQAEAALQVRLRHKAMKAGVTMLAPETVTLAYDTHFERDVTLEPHVVFGPGVKVEEGAVIHAFSHLVGARVGAGATIGPFARLRPGTHVGQSTKIGNFVEIKNCKLGDDVKVSHLTYLGDAIVGDDANIGAGTVTCNYDGFRKFKTVIGEGAFVGSNTSLVAPIKIGAGAYIGSGSVITYDVPDKALAIARGRQTIKEGWVSEFEDKLKTP